MTPNDKSDLLARIESEWVMLMQAVERLTPEQMSQHGADAWSVKDNLAHLAEWEQIMLRYHLRGEPEHVVMGVAPGTFEQWDVDAVNAFLYNRNKDRTAQDVLDGLKRSHTQVLATLEGMSFPDLMKPHFPDDPEHRTVLDEVIGNTYDHYAKHRAAIEKIVQHNELGKK